MIRLPAPSSDLTTLRLSIPVQEGSTEAGAAQILTLLGLERARGAAAATGAHVEGSRTPWGIAYTVVGPTADFDHLAYVLREAVAEPSFDRIVFERARSRVRVEAQRERETASGRLTAELRAAVAPEALPAVGTPASIDVISMVTLRNPVGPHPPAGRHVRRAGRPRASRTGVGFTPRHRTGGGGPHRNSPPPDHQLSQTRAPRYCGPGTERHGWLETRATPTGRW